MPAQPQQPPANVVAFFEKVIPRVGPMNAFGLLKDVQISAAFEILKSLGITQERIDEELDAQMQKTAQNIVNSTSVPSPLQRM